MARSVRGKERGRSEELADPWRGAAGAARTRLRCLHRRRSMPENGKWRSTGVAWPAQWLHGGCRPVARREVAGWVALAVGEGTGPFAVEKGNLEMDLIFRSLLLETI